MTRKRSQRRAVFVAAISARGESARYVQGRRQGDTGSRRDDVIATFQQLKMSDALIEKLVNVGLLAEAQDVCLAPAFRAAPVERLKEREARAATGTGRQPFGEVDDAGSAAASQKPVDDAPFDRE
jgi:hypothetical protein